VVRKAYSHEQVREAVALARVVGAEVAAETLGMDARTVRGWLAKAGDPPELQGSASQWSQALELAQAKLGSKIASGKLTAVQLATVAGIAERNLANIGKAQPGPSGTTALEVRDQLTDWIVDNLVDEADLTDEAVYEADHDAIDGLVSELLRLANAEDHQPHRPAILAWHSGKAEVAAEADLMDWATAHLSQLVMEHGDLITAATEARRVEQERWRFDNDLYAERAARVRMYVESGVSVAEAIARAQEPVELDPETLALLERAEAYLENPE